MAVVPEVHQYDIGTIFRFEVLNEKEKIIDLSVATTKEIIFKTPNGTTLTKPASLTTDGKDGLMEYTTVAGDLDQAGSWQRQGHLVLSAGEWRSSIVQFTVHSNL